MGLKLIQIEVCRANLAAALPGAPAAIWVSWGSSPRPQQPCQGLQQPSGYAGEAPLAHSNHLGMLGKTPWPTAARLWWESLSQAVASP